FNAQSLGLGIHTIVYTVNGGTPKASNVNDPGCVQSVSATVSIVSTPTTVACNDAIQVSMDENCEALITPDMVLEGTYGCFDNYRLELRTSSGGVVSNPIPSFYIGKTVIARVTHIPSGNSCWGEIHVEDKFAPSFDCAISYPVNYHSGTLGAGDLRYRRTATFVPGNNPNTCILSNVGTNNLYETLTFTVTVPGMYSFEMLSADYDAFGALYQGSFDPANPCQNLLAADDDSAN